MTSSNNFTTAEWLSGSRFTVCILLQALIILFDSQHVHFYFVSLALENKTCLHTAALVKSATRHGRRKDFLGEASSG